VAAVDSSTLASLAATASAAADFLALASTSGSLNDNSAIPAPTSYTQPLSTQSTPVERTPTSMPVERTLTSMPVDLTMSSIAPTHQPPVIGRGISAIAALPAEVENGEAVKSPHPAIPTETPSNNDVNMRSATSGVTPSPKPKDNNLPPWLTLMVDYLHGVSEDVAWQDLVTEFVDFKKHYPLNGVSLSVSFIFFIDPYYYFINRTFL